MNNLKVKRPEFGLFLYLNMDGNIYAVQQDTQSFLMIEFYSSHMLAGHVSDLTAVFPTTS